MARAKTVAQLPKHLVIPDTQVKPGVPTDHMRWIGQYIVDTQPEVVVHLGDHWDMPSLSSYDKGKKSFEGRRYEDDVQAGNVAMDQLNEALIKFNRGKKAAQRYNPRRVFLFGNHCNRINRAVEDNAVLDGKVGLDDLNLDGWETHDFLEVVWIDGIAYSHYFYNPMNGRPYGGQAATRLKTIGHSFSQGHQQILDMSLRFVGGKSQHALICGANYLHDENYLGPQGNSYWRGVVVCHEVNNGSYDIMTVSLDYLCRRYEGMPLDEFLDKKYIRPKHFSDPWLLK